MSTDSSFEGEIKVASQIVDYLSSGLYESPSACLKELINNSFDADAKEVNVFIKPDANRIIIEDDGHGMSQSEFIKHFSMISESYKRQTKEHTELGRPKIGKIGIGFIAANEICNIMEVVSTKKGSDELLKVSIDFKVMRKDPVLRKSKKNEITKADYIGKVEKTNKIENQFTHVFLKDIRGEAKSILAHEGTSKYSTGDRSLYGLKSKSVSKILKQDNIKSWSNFDSYSKNSLEIGLNVPVKYHDNWLPERLKSKVKQFEDRVNKLNFNLFIDGSEIRKPIVFDPDDKAFISEFNFEGENISATGYFYVQHGGINPEELQGILLRIRNAAIGGYDSNFLDFSSSRGKIFQQWISGEIYADDRLEKAMNIDRKTLRVAQPEYTELQNAVHEHLDKLLTKARKDLYGAGAEKRKIKRAESIEKKINNVIKGKSSEIGTQTATKIERVWEDSSKDDVSKKKILKKYTVDEFYDLVIEVAEEVLPEQKLNKFLELLTDRLQK